MQQIDTKTTQLFVMSWKYNLLLWDSRKAVRSTVQLYAVALGGFAPSEQW